MSVPNDAIVQVTASFYPSFGSVHQNTFHFVVDATSPAAEALVLNAAELAMSAFYSPFEEFLHTSMTTPLIAVDLLEWLEVEAKWHVTTHIGDAGITGIAGAASDAPLPPGAALLLSFIPVYRNHTGKKYIGGLTEASNDASGTPDSTLIAAGINAIDAILGIDWTIETGLSTMSYAILDRSVGGFYYYPVAGLIRNNWSYQRRRKSGVGL